MLDVLLACFFTEALGGHMSFKERKYICSFFSGTIWQHLKISNDLRNNLRLTIFSSDISIIQRMLYTGIFMAKR